MSGSRRGLQSWHTRHRVRENQLHGRTERKRTEESGILLIFSYCWRQKPRPWTGYRLWTATGRVELWGGMSPQHPRVHPGRTQMEQTAPVQGLFVLQYNKSAIWMYKKWTKCKNIIYAMLWKEINRATQLTSYWPCFTSYYGRYQSPTRCGKGTERSWNLRELQPKNSLATSVGGCKILPALRNRKAPFVLSSGGCATAHRSAQERAAKNLPPAPLASGTSHVLGGSSVYR